MEIIVGGIVIGLGLALLWGFVTFVAASMGIPLERRKTREAREELARQIQAQAIEDEARWQLLVEQRKAQLRGE